MKKRLAILFAALMVFGSSMTALAATSPTTEAAKQQEEAKKEAATLSSAVTASEVLVDGQPATVTIKTLDTTVVAQAKAQAAAVVSPTATVLKAFDVSLPSGNFTSAKITFDVPTIVAGQKVTVLHQKHDGTWETIKDVSVANGKITATFTSLSPVVIVVADKSDKTSDTLPVFPIVAVIACLGGAVYLGKKYALVK